MLGFERRRIQRFASSQTLGFQGFGFMVQAGVLAGSGRPGFWNC